MRRQPVPDLTKDLIFRVKAAALAKLPDHHAATVRRLRETADAARGGKERSFFLHPAGYAGPAELAVMAARLEGNSKLQVAAKESLITVRDVDFWWLLIVGGGGWRCFGICCVATKVDVLNDKQPQGKGVPPKYQKGGWAPPVGTPLQGWGGPFSMETFKTDWGEKFRGVRMRCEHTQGAVVLFCLLHAVYLRSLCL